jgi:uncharacterized protein YjbI with pentapeptide repeats
MITEIKRKDFERLSARWETPKGKEQHQLIIQVIRNGGNGIEDIVNGLIYSDESEDQKDLRAFKFNGVSIQSINFDWYDLYFSVFNNLDIVESSFRESMIMNCSFESVAITHCDFSNSFLDFSDFTNVKFIRCNFENATFAGSIFQNVELESCNVKNTQFMLTNHDILKFTNTEKGMANFLGND